MSSGHSIGRPGKRPASRSIAASAASAAVLVVMPRASGLPATRRLQPAARGGRRRDYPLQRGTIALDGARALGLIGRFGEAVALCRQALGPAGAYPAELRERLEAELVPNGLVHASTIAEARRYARERPPGSSAPELWRVSAAAVGGLIDNRAAAETQALLRPALEHDALAAEPGSLLASLATLHLIIDDELTTAFALCEALVDVARPRGWLIALAHGCMFRAMALIRVGEIRDAEADARLAFEYKLPVARPAPGRGAARSAVPARSRRPSTASPSWPPADTATVPSPSGCT